jgi:hypothetical protein
MSAFSIFTGDGDLDEMKVVLPKRIQHETFVLEVHVTYINLILPMTGFLRGQDKNSKSVL